VKTSGIFMVTRPAKGCLHQYTESLFAVGQTGGGYTVQGG